MGAEAVDQLRRFGAFQCLHSAQFVAADKSEQVPMLTGPRDKALILCPRQLWAATENGTAQNPALLGAQHAEGPSGRLLGLRAASRE
ncbi:unnamed protein product [Rangifer tarandus platyrhynchus]|uniref:Uncharacterized protein n=1 Tax=Rangifer tarandus platyrhynchus TaxID=3082113 RepID=A0AC59YIB7_RANTA